MLLWLDVKGLDSLLRFSSAPVRPEDALVPIKDNIIQTLKSTYIAFHHLLPPAQFHGEWEIVLAEQDLPAFLVVEPASEQDRHIEFILAKELASGVGEGRWP